MFLSVILLLLLPFGCSRRTAPSSALPGVYTCKYSYATEQLTLSADGTYVQSMQVANGQALTNRGVWQQSADKTSLQLRSAIVIDEGDRPAKTPFKGDWLLAINFDGKRCEFIVNSDVDLRFR